MNTSTRTQHERGNYCHPGRVPNTNFHPWRVPNTTTRTQARVRNMNVEIIVILGEFLPYNMNTSTRTQHEPQQGGIMSLR